MAQSGGRYTKHIYIGSQRIVSKLGDFDSYGADPRRIEKAGDSFSGVKVDYASKYKSALNVVKANYESLKVPYYGLDNDDYVNGLGFCCKPATSSTPAAASGTSPTGKSAANKTDNAELQQYYYHPDHLGSSSYISNLDGEVVQHVEYVPFGEVFLEEKNAVWNTPYLFNGKELDKETGMSYYGARYYEAKTSVWLSVDPLAEEFAGRSPYEYCFSNPVNLIDPTGMGPDDWVSFMGHDGQQQVVYDAEIKSKEQAEAKYQNVSDVFKSGSITGTNPNGGDYSYSLQQDGSVVDAGGANIDKGFTTPQGTYVGENKSTLAQLAPVFQNSGDAAVVVGTILVCTGVGAPLGAGLITYGGYASLAGTAMELKDNANTGTLTPEKVATKVAMELIPAGAGAGFNRLGAPAAGEFFNAATVGADRLLDEMRDAKAGPYRE